MLQEKLAANFESKRIRLSRAVLAREAPQVRRLRRAVPRALPQNIVFRTQARSASEENTPK